MYATPSGHFPVHAADFPRVVDVWEESVRATYHEDDAIEYHTREGNTMTVARDAFVPAQAAPATTIIDAHRSLHR